MTYTAKETGKLTGNPIYLYRFTRGGVNYDYCNQPEDVTVGAPISGTFAASSLSHGKTYIGPKSAKNKVDFIFPKADTFAFTFVEKQTFPQATTIIIWRGHLDDVDGEFIIEFSGKIRLGSPNSNDTIKLIGISEAALLEEMAFGAFTHRTCRHPLYGPGCTLDVALFRDTATVTAIDDNVLTITEASSQPDGHYVTGRFEYDGYSSFITGHTGTSITVRGIPPGLQADFDDGDEADATIARGCNRSFAVCRDIFANELNFGGFQAFPIEDPWNDGSIV